MHFRRALHISNGTGAAWKEKTLNIYIHIHIYIHMCIYIYVYIYICTPSLPLFRKKPDIKSSKRTQAMCVEFVILE